MIEVGILDGDLLAVHSTPVAKNGDIIVARIENDVTVKRLQRTNQKHLLHLLPENKDYQPTPSTRNRPSRRRSPRLPSRTASSATPAR